MDNHAYAAGMTAIVTRITLEPPGDGRAIAWWHIEADRQTFHMDFWLEHEPSLAVDDELIITVTKGDSKPGWTKEWMRPKAGIDDRP